MIELRKFKLTKNKAYIEQMIELNKGNLLLHFLWLVLFPFGCSSLFFLLASFAFSCTALARG